jgi:hypothetical protein
MSHRCRDGARNRLGHDGLPTREVSRETCGGGAASQPPKSAAAGGLRPSRRAPRLATTADGLRTYDRVMLLIWSAKTSLLLRNAAQRG